MTDDGWVEEILPCGTRLPGYKLLSSASPVLQLTGGSYYQSKRMTGETCSFCHIDATRIFHLGERVLGIWDGYPVSPGHALLITRRHVTGWFEATGEEQRELTATIEIARREILKKYEPDGFNVGVNIGEASGQTVFHLDVHVIPRYRGDVPNPCGGIRHVVPHKADYLDSTSGEGRVQEATSPWPRSGQNERTETDAAAFGERILQLLDESRRTATYKYAVLLALTDLCIENCSVSGDPPSTFTTRQLAEKVLEFYWPHTIPFDGKQGMKVLRQTTGGQAEILSAIRKFRERFASDPSEPLSTRSAATCANSRETAASIARGG